jgi:non-specific serine/threonine protein kinase
MLETIREFAREQLAESGDEEELLRRHALEFTRFAEEADVGLRSGDQLLWFERLEAEHDNLRAALESSLASGDDETALRLGGALGWFWYTHGHALEGCTRLTELLARTEGAPVELRARPLLALGILLDQRGEPERAVEPVERSLVVFRQQGDLERIGGALNSLGSIKRALGDFDAARPLLEESLTIRRELGDDARTASTLGNLGTLAFERGHFDDAEARFLEELELDRAHGNEWGTCAALDSLAAVAIERGQHERARELTREMLGLAERVGDSELIAFGLEKAAILAAMVNDAARAGRLAGAADAVRESAGIERSGFDQEGLARHLSRVAGEEFDTRRAAVGQIALEDALREARGE